MKSWEKEPVEIKVAVSSGYALISMDVGGRQHVLKLSLQQPADAGTLCGAMHAVANWVERKAKDKT